MYDTICALVWIIGVPALLLWTIEFIAKHIGTKRTTILLLGIIPSLCGLGIAYLARDKLHWWEFAYFAVLPSIFLCGVILVAYISVSPSGLPDVLGLLCSGIKFVFCKIKAVLSSK